MKSSNYYVLIICILSINNILFSQAVSERYLNIFTNATLTDQQKEKKFDSLLKVNKQNKKFDDLIYDAFDILRWKASQGKLQEAINLNKQNLSLMDSMSYQDENIYRKNIYSLGFYQKRQNNITDAIATQKRLLQYTEPDALAMKGAFQIGEMYFSLDKYYLALNHYRLSKTISEQTNNDLYIVKNDLKIAIANKHINTNHSLNEGIEILTKTAEHIKKINNDDNLKNNIKLKFVQEVYNQLGNLYCDREDYDFKKSKQNYDIALQLAQNLNDVNVLSNINNDIGYLLINEKSIEAEAYLMKALEHARNYTILSKIYRNLSRHYLNINNFDQASKNIQKSLEALLPPEGFLNDLPTKESLKTSRQKLDILSSIIVKADISLAKADANQLDQDHYYEALKTLRLADFLVDQARLESNVFKSKLFWRKTATEIYVNATKASILVNNPKDAFYFIEKNKAFLLLEDVSLKISRNESNIPMEVSEREIALKNRIKELETIDNLKNDDKAQNLLILANDDYTQFIDSLDVNYRFYYKSKQPANVIQLKAFKSKYVNANNAYLEYIIDDQEGYGILITQKDTKVFQINNVDSLKTLTLKYRQLLETPFQNQSTIDEYKHVSNTIYKSLFPEEIQALIEGKRLTIVPDYYLQNIPFESLETSTKNNSYLIFQNEISYAYSLSFLNENDKIARNNNQNFVGFAPIQFPSNLPSLPNTENELKTIKSLFSTKLFFNENATKSNFFENSKNSKIIHIASHASANDSINPWIAFQDSKVNLDELYELNNTADLVVLSACNTSLGELFKGEGVMSLSRGFFNTGAHSVLPTLWEVNDQTSVEILKSFYENIKLGQRKSEALHNAKLKYIESNSLSQASPYYWASFILIGDDGKIQLDEGFSLFHYLIFGLTLLIIIVLIVRLKKRKK